MVTDLHQGPFLSVAAFWEETGQSQSLVLFLYLFLVEIGQSLKLLSFVVFFVGVTGQSLNRVCSETSWPVVTDEDQVNVSDLRVFSWQAMNLTKIFVI